MNDPLESFLTDFIEDLTHIRLNSERNRSLKSCVVV